QTWPRDVQNIVHTAWYPVVAFFVPAAAISREVHAWIVGEVGLDEPLVIAEHGAHLPRPTIENDEMAGTGAFDQLALVVDDPRHDPEYRQCSRARLELHCARP